ncbi:MAG: hypothetical protein ACTSX1_00640 [Candidatus Heimdallarchaeaceae archaeon]
MDHGKGNTEKLKPVRKPAISKVDMGGKVSTDTEIELADKLNELIDKFNDLHRNSHENS